MSLPSHHHGPRITTTICLLEPFPSPPLTLPPRHQDRSSSRPARDPALTPLPRPRFGAYPLGPTSARSRNQASHVSARLWPPGPSQCALAVCPRSVPSQCALAVCPRSVPRSRCRANRERRTEDGGRRTGCVRGRIAHDGLQESAGARAKRSGGEYNTSLRAPPSS
jgi:hypothetical protein